MSEDTPQYGKLKHVQRWEHKVFKDKSPASPKITELEQHGWELVAVLYKKPNFIFYFKREKLDSDD